MYIMITISTEKAYTNNEDNCLTNFIYKHAIFDFDSSIFSLGKEWHNIMISYFVEVLLNTPMATTFEESSALCKNITDLINSMPEKNTIYYCSWLNETAVNYGGLAKNPCVYKQEFLNRLRNYLKDSYKSISNNRVSIDKMLIPGVKEFFRTLKRMGVKLYCISSMKTPELRYVLELLELSEFFGENIFGVEYEHDFINTKGFVVDRIIHSIGTNDFVMFSNNGEDINITKEYGGYAISVIDDKKEYNVKKYGLVADGPDMFISNYKI